MKRKESVRYWAGAMLLLVSGCYFRNNLFEVRQKTTYATLIELDIPRYKAGSYDLYEFQANGKKFNCRGIDAQGLALGEKYKVVYDSIDPKNIHKLLLYEPIFLENERTGFTIGKINFLRKNRRDVGYDYIVNGIKYNDRFQYLEKEAKYYPTLLAKDAYHLVKYWLDNPLRAIIYFDQPILTSTESVTTVTRINVLDQNRDSQCYYSFTINSDTFTYKGMCYLGITPGDKFRMINYGTKDSGIHPDIHYSEPLFLPNEKTEMTTGEAMIPQKNGQLVRFIYKVNGVQYTREQALNVKTEDYLKQLDIQKTRRYKVAYWVDNPQRAIIYLDQPVK